MPTATVKKRQSLEGKWLVCSDCHDRCWDNKLGEVLCQVQGGVLVRWWPRYGREEPKTKFLRYRNLELFDVVHDYWKAVTAYGRLRGE